MTRTPASRGATHNSSTLTSNSTRRYWRRTDNPRPWWPWGIVPIAGLLGTFLVGAVFVAPRIEADVRTSVQERLDGQNFASAAQSSGQGIAIQAQAFEQDREYLDALARSTQCDTWAGRLICPTTVQLLLDAPEAELPAEVATPAIVEATPAPAAESMAGSSMDAAGAVAIVDQGPSAEDLCNEDFAAILSRSTIQFNTASADISPQSNNVLAEIANVAKTCPGTIYVEGHTDSRGDAEMNLALSDARAASVRSALSGLGIESGRLVAEGFGETRPTADNTTADGRASNRRIVISVRNN